MRTLQVFFFGALCTALFTFVFFAVVLEDAHNADAAHARWEAYSRAQSLSSSPSPNSSSNSSSLSSSNSSDAPTTAPAEAPSAAPTLAPTPAPVAAGAPSTLAPAPSHGGIPNFSITDYHSDPHAMLAAYKLFHDVAKKQLHPDPRLKYIIFTPTEAGFGNRIRVLLAGYIVALFTGRVLLLDWHTPLRLDEFFDFRMDMMYEFDMKERLLNTQTFHMLISCDGSRNEGEIVVEKDSDVLGFLNAHNEQTVFLEGCGDINQPLVLFDNSSRTIFEQVWHPGVTPREVHHDLLLSLWDASAELNEMMQPYREAMRAADLVISMHIRTGQHAGFWAMLLDGEHTKFFDCAEQHEANFTGNHTHNSTKFLLLTDTKSVMEAGMERFRDRLLYVTEPIVHSGDEVRTQEDENGNKRTRKGLFKVMADYWLFGEAHIMIPTSGSSFSRAAIWRANSTSIVADMLPVWPQCALPGDDNPPWLY